MRCWSTAMNALSERVLRRSLTAVDEDDGRLLTIHVEPVRREDRYIELRFVLTVLGHAGSLGRLIDGILSRGVGEKVVCVAIGWSPPDAANRLRFKIAHGHVNTDNLRSPTGRRLFLKVARSICVDQLGP